MCCRTRRRAASGRPRYKDYFTDDASLSESALLDEEDDDEDDDDDEFLSEISMREGHYGMQSRNSSLQSADASHFKSSGQPMSPAVSSGPPGLCAIQNDTLEAIKVSVTWPWHQQCLAVHLQCVGS